MTFAARMRVKAAHAEARNSDRARLNAEAEEVRRLHDREEWQKQITKLVKGEWRECIEKAAESGNYSVKIRNAAVSPLTGKMREEYKREVCQYGRKLLEQEGFSVEVNTELVTYSDDDRGSEEVDLIVSWILK